MGLSHVYDGPVLGMGLTEEFLKPVAVGFQDLWGLVNLKGLGLNALTQGTAILWAS